MKLLRIITLSLFLFVSHISISVAGTTHYLDFKLILNESNAGKKAQSFLKNKLEKGIKSIQEKEKKIQSEEKKIIQQKKVISAEEYKKKVTGLRSKVTSLQKERQTLLNSVAKQRAKAKSELIKNLNPILKNYMVEKNIKMVIDKKNLLLADDTLDISKDIMSPLNKKLSSIKLD